MVEIIKKELDNYLEFDSNELFWDHHVDLAVIFGGSIRDIISGDADKINDIDIMGLPISLGYIHRTLELNDYKQIELVKPDIFTLYKNIKYIFEPITYMNKNQKIVQLIRPFNQNISDLYFSQYNELNIFKNNYYKLLSNVDLTSSGLFYDGKELYESVRHSFIHCKMKVYEKLPNALMYNSERTDKRIHKLHKTKDWRKLNTEDKLEMRKIKLHQLNSNIKTLDDYINKTISLKGTREKSINEFGIQI